ASVRSSRSLTSTCPRSTSLSPRCCPGSRRGRRLSWPAIPCSCSAPCRIHVLKDLGERDRERLGDLERDFERRRVLAKLDRVDGLPRHANSVGELLLRHFLVLEAQPADVVVNRLRHVRCRVDRERSGCRTWSVPRARSR